MLFKNNELFPIYNKFLHWVKYKKNVVIGDNNYISKKAIIHNNVTIGNNNKIYDYVEVFPHTTIGDNNYIYPRSHIGDMVIDTKMNDYSYDFSKGKGVSIGNDNLIHVECVIISGIHNKTVLGNNNKFMGRVLIGHDVKIHDNITIYPACTIGGSAVLLNHSNIGMGSIVNQNIVIGDYCMIGSCNAVTKNAFPYFITIHNKIHRLNFKKVPEYILKYEDELKNIYNDVLRRHKYDSNKYLLDDKIKSTLNNYFTYSDNKIYT